VKRCAFRSCAKGWHLGEAAAKMPPDGECWGRETHAAVTRAAETDTWIPGECLFVCV
jgi:hypothetical protein